MGQPDDVLRVLGGVKYKSRVLKLPILVHSISLSKFLNVNTLPLVAMRSFFMSSLLTLNLRPAIAAITSYFCLQGCSPLVRQFGEMLKTGNFITGRSIVFGQPFGFDDVFAGEFIWYYEIGGLIKVWNLFRPTDFTEV